MNSSICTITNSNLHTEQYSLDKAYQEDFLKLFQTNCDLKSNIQQISQLMHQLEN